MHARTHTHTLGRTPLDERSARPREWRTEGGGVWRVQTPSPPKFRSFDKAEPNSQFRGKRIHNNLIRIRVSPICKLSEPLTRGLPPPDPRSLCPLSSTEFVELPSPPYKIPGYATGPSDTCTTTRLRHPRPGEI
jgi:hypothetical protein